MRQQERFTAFQWSGDLLPHVLTIIPRNHGGGVHVVGRYLAHFAVLKSVHDAAKAKTAAVMPVEENHATTHPPPSVNVSAAFPNRIHVLIDEGFAAITGDIKQWRRRAAGEGAE